MNVVVLCIVDISRVKFQSRKQHLGIRFENIFICLLCLCPTCSALELSWYFLRIRLLVWYLLSETWWPHKMETFSALLPFARGIHRSPVNSQHKGQWGGALMLSLICVWINDWVNNREAGDLRRYRAHYDVTIMKQSRNQSVKFRKYVYIVSSLLEAPGAKTRKGGACIVICLVLN